MQQNCLLAAGPDMHESDGSQLRLPKLQDTTSDDVGLYAENELIADSQVEFDSIVMLSPQLKSVKCMVGFSNEQLRSSVVSMEAAIRDRLTYKVSRKLDYMFFEGAGKAAADANGNFEPLGMLKWVGASEVQRITVNGTPTGGTFTLTFRGQTTTAIARNATAAAVQAALEALSTIGAGNVVGSGGPLPTTPVDIAFAGTLALQNVPTLIAAHALTGGTAMGVTVVATTPGAEGAQSIDKASANITLDDLQDMVGMAQGAWAEPNRWFMTPMVLTYIRKLKDGYNRYQLEPSPVEANGFILFGHPVSLTNHMAVNAPTTGVSSIALVDMSQVAVARDLEPSVRVLDQLRGDRDQTVIRVVARYDIAPRNAKGVVIANNVLST
jgi:hypothetical protein